MFVVDVEEEVEVVLDVLVVELVVVVLDVEEVEDVEEVDVDDVEVVVDDVVVEASPMGIRVLHNVTKSSDGLQGIDTIVGM
jgi:hypothetical protein